MVGPDTAYARPEDRETFDDWIPVYDWNSSQEDATWLISLAQQYQAKWLVLDDYRVDEDYQLRLHEAGMHWLQWDGTASKPLWADIVVNANPAARSEDYATVLRNPDARLLLGPRYAILRPEFEQVKPRGREGPVKQILLTFGGGDDRGANEFVLSTLLPVTASDQHFVVLSGATNPSNPRLNQWIDAHGEGRVSLHIDPVQVAPLFVSSDLAVMAGGASTFEAACCGLPMMLLTVADNQISLSNAWAATGAAIHLGKIGLVDRSDLVGSYQNIINYHPCRTSMANMGIQLVKANGAAHVAGIMGE